MTYRKSIPGAVDVVSEPVSSEPAKPVKTESVSPGRDYIAWCKSLKYDGATVIAKQVVSLAGRNAV